MSISFLSLGAGGVRGVAHLGVLDGLSEKYTTWREDLQVVLGSSVGALIAMLLAIGLDPITLLHNRKVPNFSLTFECDAQGRQSMFSPSTLRKNLADLIQLAGYDPYRLKLKALQRPNLWVVCFEQSLQRKREIKVFKPSTDPEVLVLDVVQASMSPTPFFPAVDIGGSMYSDAGVCPSVKKYFPQANEYQKALAVCLSGSYRKLLKPIHREDQENSKSHFTIRLDHLKRRVPLGTLCLSQSQRAWLFKEGKRGIEQWLQ